jgi:MoxR-like ATPase
VRSLSQALSLDFGRIQFTPDMMPADVTGTNILSQGAFEFRRGPIFANLVLADEINRATPKTQSAMLEAMQERSVTVSGHRYALPEPFLVMATQNPIEQEGTYPLPEAQLDRFFFKLIVPYPSKAELAEIINRTTGHADATVTAVANHDDVIKLRTIAREVTVADGVLDYALKIVVGTHPTGAEATDISRRYCRFGSSPRGAQSMISAAKVFALLESRFNVAKEDLRKAAALALRHRILLNFEAEADGISADEIIRQVIEAVDAMDRDPIRA